MRAQDPVEGLAQKTDRILALGVSEFDAVEQLYLSGYVNVYALAPNKSVYDGPHNKVVRYVYGDPCNTHFPNDFFKVVLVKGTAFEATDDVKREVRRLLCDGGAAVFEDAAKETATKPSPRPIADIDILMDLAGNGGISEYSRIMRTRIETEWGVKVNIRRRKEEVGAENVVVQFENGLPNADRIIDDALDLGDSGRAVYFDVHSAFSDLGIWSRYLPQLQAKTMLLYRANEIAEADGVDVYTLFPHLSYKNVPELPPRRVPVKLGSFGFASRGKNHGELIRMARRLKVPLVLLLSVNTEVSPKVAEDMREYIASLQRLAGGGVDVVGGFFSYEEIEERLAECSHLIFTTPNALGNSGSMQFAKRLNKPILSLEGFQAVQAQTHEFGSLSDRRTAVGRQFMLISSRMIHVIRDRPEVAARLTRAFFSRESRAVIFSITAQVMGELYRAASSNRAPISRAFIKAHTELSRDEDGLEYLHHVLCYPGQRAVSSPHISTPHHKTRRMG